MDSISSPVTELLPQKPDRYRPTVIGVLYIKIHVTAETTVENTTLMFSERHFHQDPLQVNEILREETIKGHRQEGADVVPGVVDAHDAQLFRPL